MFRKVEGTRVSVPLGITLEPQGLSTGAAVVDNNQDGRLELWIVHGESGGQTLSLYQWTNHGFHWLRIAPLTNNRAPARGSKITIYHRRGRIQRRMIDMGSGYLCQMEPVAHFGLGEDSKVEKVVVEWVDGTQKEVNHISVDQLLTISLN